MAARRARSPFPQPDLSATSLASLPSMTLETTHSSASRLDPFWSAMAVGSLVASWESRNDVERLREAHARAPHRDLSRSAADARRTLRRGSVSGLASLGAITMWRAVTTEQLSAFAGWVGPTPTAKRPSMSWTEVPRPVRRLWTADLVDRGKIVSHEKSLPVLWRPASRPVARRWLDSVDFGDWLSLTGGGPWAPAGRQGDLHNVLIAELGLRIAEHTDTATVLGEMVCGFDLLLPAKWAGKGKRVPSGDMAAVREDGMRIVFEMTVHQSRDRIRNKVKRWVDLLTDAEFQDSGITVCFVEAMPPDLSGAEVSRYLNEEILDELAHRPEATHYRVRERIAVARWRWWFPKAHYAAPGFAPLLAFRPTGSGTDRWEPIELMNPRSMPFEPRDPEQITAIIRNSRLLAGIPQNIRDRLYLEYGDGEDALTRMALEQTGLARVYDQMSNSQRA